MCSLEANYKSQGSQTCGGGGADTPTRISAGGVVTPTTYSAAPLTETERERERVNTV